MDRKEIMIGQIEQKALDSINCTVETRPVKTKSLVNWDRPLQLTRKWLLDD